MSRYDDLEQLHRMHTSGVLSEAEYEREKARLLAEPDPPECGYPRDHASARYWGMDEPTYCMFLHLAQFSGMVVPVGGLVIPLVMWLIYRKESPVIDANGRVVMNWIVSSLIYMCVSIPLCFIIVGIPLLIAIVVMSIVCTIIGAVRANQGQLWPYPLSLPIFGRPRPRDESP